MYTFYDEADPLAAVGSVTVAQENKNRPFLKANCQLNAMWSSPDGNLWVVDDHGDVYTTADAVFSKPPYKGLTFNSGAFDTSWRVSEVFSGQLNGIWGTSDSDVWVTSFRGPALHWNGRQWRQHGLPEAPNAIDGSATDDVYVVGYHGNIHHWNGERWCRVSLPAGIPQGDAFTDVHVVDQGQVYIAGRSGSVLVGSAQSGFRNIGSTKYSWYGIGCLNGRIFLAGGEQGIFELIGEQFVCLKDKGHPVAIFETSNAINFIPAEQNPNPWFVRYEPGAEREWSKINT